jgi:glycosyltransferase involved in cell wall biosynthesis
VFCRRRYNHNKGDTFRGVKLKNLPAIYTKHLEAISHTFIAMVYALHEHDIVHFNATGPSLLAFIPRAFGKKAVVTVHGLDWKREKWGALASLVLRIGEWAAIAFPHMTIVVSKTLREHYRHKYGRSVDYVPNGIAMPSEIPVNEIHRFGLEQDRYILFLSRLVPEKGCHTLVEAFKELRTDKKLAIVGDPSHSTKYALKLRDLAKEDGRIIFTGALYGTAKAEMYSNAYFFVLPSTIEGLAIAMLEAMSYGKCVLCSDIDENLEVVRPSSVSREISETERNVGLSGGSELGDNVFGVSFRSGDVEHLRRQMTFLVEHPEVVKGIGRKAREYVAAKYSWDSIAQRTLNLYRDMITG